MLMYFTAYVFYGFVCSISLRMLEVMTDCWDFAAFIS